MRIKALIGEMASSVDSVVANYIKVWLEFLLHEKKYSWHTIKNYFIDIKDFCFFLQDHLAANVSKTTLASVSLLDFRAFLASRIQKNISHRSNARAISTIRSFFFFLEKNYFINNSAIYRLKSSKYAATLPHPISAEKAIDITTNTSKTVIINSNKQQSLWITHRNQTIFLLLYGCGLRIAETLNLNVQDISNIHNQECLLVKGKGNKERMIPLLDVVKKALLNYLSIHPHRDNGLSPLFLGIKGKRVNTGVIQKDLRNMRTIASLPDNTTPHSLRHSFATHLLANGVNLKAIQELLGHKNLSTTQKYIKIESEQLAKLYLKTHPLAKP